MTVTKKSIQTRTSKAHDPPIGLFENKEDWAAWLETSHRKSSGLWLRIAKKGSTFRSVTYKEALEIALCYGWIDGQKRPESEQSWLQRFLPRSAKSLWSKINRESALALIASGEMKPAGLEAIENAKQHGRWHTAYDSPSKAAVPSDFQAALDNSQNAKAFFETLDKANRYALLWRIQTAKKPETRARKITHFIAMLERKEKIHE
ncbi:MAG: YdeI/OmpD-associated family protein [Bryobacteraceae bacterium]